MKTIRTDVLHIDCVERIMQCYYLTSTKLIASCYMDDLGFQPVCLVIRKNRPRWFAYMDVKLLGQTLYSCV